MKGIVRLSVILSVCVNLAKADAGSKDEQPKQLINTPNTISPQQKPDLLSYQQITHFGDKFQPEQVVYQQRYQTQPRTQLMHQTTAYQNQQEHQPTPVAMVIIAQPAYIPASMLQQGNVAQQLLNYFHGNSQGRYQFLPLRNNQPPQQQYAVPAPVQQQRVPQYVNYQSQKEIAQYQPSGPTAQAQATQFYPHEALPSPQALISQQHIAPHNLPQQSIHEGRSLQYQPPQQQIQYQHENSQQNEQQQQQQQQQSQYNEHQQKAEQQQTEQQQSDYEKPRQLTEISQLAQQAAQHFLMNGGLNSGSRTAPAIITGLEHFSPQQQEKIKAQLGAHFGSPLQPLNLGTAPNGQKNVMHPTTTYYHDNNRRVKTDKFVPSIEVKNGEITQSTAGGDGKI